MQRDRKELFYALQLIRSKNIGPRRYKALVDRFNSAKKAIYALKTNPEDFLNERSLKTIQIADEKIIEQEFAYAEKIGVGFITISDTNYPQYLKEIDSPPPVIAVKGNLGLLNRPSIAIVGSRNASVAGQKISYSFAQKLGIAGLTICSGFARGIDAQAHQAALKTGTIAVVAGGIDHIYPPEHDKLYHEILDHGGLFVSEMPLNWQPRAVDFPRRNRIIAGLSLGLLVVEASQRSGSLITANFAAESGRIVFAIPGSPLDPRAKGPNNLIKNGGNLVDNPDDIIAALNPLVQNADSGQSQLKFFRQDKFLQTDYNTKPEVPSARYKKPNLVASQDLINENEDIVDARSEPEDGKNNSPDELTNNEKKILISCLSPTPVTIDSLAQATQIPLSKLYLGLMELDLAGHLTRHQNGKVSLAPS